MFNGQTLPNSYVKDYRYSPEAHNDFQEGIHNFILGGYKLLLKNTTNNSGRYWFGSDLVNNRNAEEFYDSLVCFGKYKVEIYDSDPTENSNSQLIDYVYWDNNDWDWNSYSAVDLYIKYYSQNNIKFMWQGGNEISINIHQLTNN